MSVFTNPASGSVQQAQSYIAAVLDLLGTRDPFDVLRQMPAALGQRCTALSDEQIMRPEAPGKWSVRHVLQHLADSELMWAYRLRMILTHERPTLTGYDQDMWAERLRYDEDRAEQALKDFTILRQANLRVLGRLAPEDHKRVGVHAERGEESVEHMIRLYAGHDLVHLRQIDRIHQAVTATPSVAG